MSNFTIVINLGQRGRIACKFANFLRTQKISWKVKSFFSFSFISSIYAFLLMSCEGENGKMEENTMTYIFLTANIGIWIYIYFENSCSQLFTVFNWIQSCTECRPNYHMWNFSSEDSSPFFPKFWYISLQTAESLPFLKKSFPDINNSPDWHSWAIFTTPSYNKWITSVLI